MSDVMTHKQAVVDDVKAKVDSTSTAVVTEYRGLTVAEISSLRKSLRAVGTDYKVYKNTLVKRAVAGTPVESLGDFLEGPTAIAFVQGDVSAVAKILRDFAKESPALVVKGGVLEGRAVSLKDLAALADLPSRDVLLAQLAGLIASPMTQMARLLKAVPQNFAYGLKALIENNGGSVAAPKTEEASAPAAAEPEAEAPAAEATTDEAEAPADAPDVSAEVEAPAVEASEEAPAAE